MYVTPIHYSIFRTLPSAKLLHLGIKNEQVHFVLRSIFRNFATKCEKPSISEAIKKHLRSYKEATLKQ